MPTPLAASLTDLSQQEGVTLFVTLLAAFEVVLHHYTHQTDIVVGSLIANRNRPEIEPLLGVFINTLILRTDVAGNPTFRELLHRVQEVALQAYAHQNVPIEKLVEELHLQRSAAGQPLAQVLFVLQNTPLPALGMTGLTMSRVPAEKWTTEFDVTFEVTQTAEGLGGSVEYDTTLFDAGTIQRLVGHFRTVLEAVTAEPDLRLADVPLLTDAERQQLLVDWNATQTTYPLDVCVPQLFEQQVERTPDAIAVTSENDRLTYQELNRRANRLSRRLLEQGVGPEMVIALLAERGSDLLAAILAVFKAGGAYLPLDPRYPPERIGQILEQSQTRLVLTASAFAPALSQATEQVSPHARPLVLQIEELLGQPQSAANLPVRCTPHNLAYVLFTSGSTGLPKGAMVEHRGMLNHMYGKMADVQLTAADTVAQNGPQCFDVSVWQSLAALLIGGRVHIVDDATALDPARLLDEVEQEAISILEVVPSMLRAIVQEIESRGDARPALRDLRWVIPTGEALPAELCRRWFSLYPHIPLLNTYGATECSDDTCHYPIHHASELHSAAPIAALGRPIGNMRAYVLDPSLQPVPVGVAGELYLGGIGVGRGYLNDAQRTAAAFVPDPFAQEPGARLYKTGDLGRFHTDGTIDFLGRIDHQVKIHGSRVELGEIEAVLCQHSDVRESAVLAREDQFGNHYLTAYVVAGSEAAPASDELRTFLQAKLPEYMVPASFVRLDALPLNPNGKLDRQALPMPDRASSDGDTPFVGPRTPVEELLAQIWTDLLGLPRISVHANFFALGGHSLLAAQLINRVREVFQVELPLRSLFDQNSTIAGMARAVAELKDDLPATPLPTLAPAPADRHQPFPLTDLQQAYWVGQTDFFDLGNISCHIYQEFELVGFALDRLAAAIDRLIARHEMLRAIVLPDGQQQILASVPPYPMIVTDLRGKVPEEIAAQLDAVRQLLAHSGPRTDRWPLFDVHAQRLDDERTRLHFSISLLICDGWSFEILMQELMLLYQEPAP
ncbi:MAG TPA: amino acid adenylation domain-containing protein, partial [Herpetosiphonaceae bacterium]|nr:amino acid adenylation domain-containing protein [Herpetosiphonaceae bacterium]